MRPNDDRTRTHVPLTNGTMVSHYRIIEKIGAGGMGEVYLAQDTKLDRKVALKFLPLHFCENMGCRERFTREAQATAKLDHPNIVAVHEVGEFQGRPFFSMQHVEGQSLKEVIAGKALPLDRIIEIAIQVCEGLQAAHESGITHRDIKPSNILIDSHGRARIVDFGLASVMGSDHLTKTGSTLGTIGYMSPEQMRGNKVDHQTDLFSFGVVLYEMITGNAPFKADSEAATLHSIANTKPELLARFRRDVPSEMQTIIDKALDKNVSTRYQHADDIVADLKRLSTSANTVHAPRRDIWNRYVVTSAIVLLLALVGYWSVTKFLTKDGQKPESARKMLAVLPFENLGDPEDEYFTDGITDEITGKLASIHELGVISRTSTMQYKKTIKNIRQIANELGVDYILEGTIRWDKGGDTSRVRILPQLIRVSDDTHLWTETYERPTTNIFALQAEIASRIAETMDFALRQSENAALRSLPTNNLEAYQAYLRGMDFKWSVSLPRESREMSVQMFQRAVALDSTFALAYAELAQAIAVMHWFGYDLAPERCSQSKVAADRASELQPDLPKAHIAQGIYSYFCRRDYDNALKELALAEEKLPNDPEVMSMQAYIFRRQGNFQSALEKLERAFAVSPRDHKLANEIGWTYLALREYQSAEKYLKQSTSLSPDFTENYYNRASLYYSWRADAGLARAALAMCPNQDDDLVRWYWFWLNVYERKYSAALNVVATMSFVNTDDLDRIIPKTMLSGVIYELLDDSARAGAFWDSSRIILEQKVKELPDEHSLHSALGLAYAGLGRKGDAIREGKMGVELLPISKDALDGCRRLEDMAVIYVMVGENDAALDQIELLLSIPCRFSVHILQLDPRYDPLHKPPRYQKLLEKYGT